jgi:hypothetical protein
VDVTVTVLHLVRTDTAPPAAAVAATDWIVYRTASGGAWRLRAHGHPPLPSGPLDHADLARLVLAADRTVTW